MESNGRWREAATRGKLVASSLTPRLPLYPFNPAVANVLMISRWARRNTTRAGRTPIVGAPS